MNNKLQPKKLEEQASLQEDNTMVKKTYSTDTNVTNNNTNIHSYRSISNWFPTLQISASYFVYTSIANNNSSLEPSMC